MSQLECECGSREFVSTVSRKFPVRVDQDGSWLNFEGDPSEILAHEVSSVFGPFECRKCEKLYEEPVDFFAIIKWGVDDLESTFSAAGVPFTQENVDIFLKSNASRVLVDRSIEEGWMILETIVDNLKWDRQFQGVIEGKVANG